MLVAKEESFPEHKQSGVHGTLRVPEVNPSGGGCPRMGVACPKLASSPFNWLKSSCKKAEEPPQSSNSQPLQSPLPTPQTPNSRNRDTTIMFGSVALFESMVYK